LACRMMPILNSPLACLCKASAPHHPHEGKRNTVKKGYLSGTALGSAEHILPNLPKGASIPSLTLVTVQAMGRGTAYTQANYFPPHPAKTNSVPNELDAQPCKQCICLYRDASKDISL